MEAPSLLDLIERSKRSGRWPLPEPLAAELCRQVASSLAAAHAETPPRLHRDVGPHCITVSTDGQVTLTGFGGRASGNHMSIEQARGRPLDARSDLFSLGQLLFELVCGRLPASDVSALALEELDAAATVNPQVTASMAAVLARALQPDPQQRFQSAAELSAALTAAVGPLAEGTLTAWLGTLAAEAVTQPDVQAVKRAEPMKPVAPLPVAAPPPPASPRSMMRALGMVGLVALPIGATLVGLSLYETRQTRLRAEYDATLRTCDIVTEPPGATVVIDGRVYRDKAPTVLRLEPGREYVVELRSSSGSMTRRLRDQQKLSVRLFDGLVYENEVYGASPRPTRVQKVETASAGAPAAEPVDVAKHDFESAPVAFDLLPSHQLVLPAANCFEVTAGTASLSRVPYGRRNAQQTMTRTPKLSASAYSQSNRERNTSLMQPLFAVFHGEHEQRAFDPRGPFTLSEPGTLCVFMMTDRSNDVVTGSAELILPNGLAKIVTAPLVYVPAEDLVLVRSFPGREFRLRITPDPGTAANVPVPVLVTQRLSTGALEVRPLDSFTTQLSDVKSAWVTVPVTKADPTMRYSVHIEKVR